MSSRSLKLTCGVVCLRNCLRCFPAAQLGSLASPECLHPSSPHLNSCILSYSIIPAGPTCHQQHIHSKFPCSCF
ncbi:hypothetical protein UPYG_G00122890 [Umbra pygmaea]|uniref:Secreted protein n=1 Tax=Umbra pygmaea TaxID=75934 RepID=A0ABD0X5F0_UMBPY